MTRGVEMSCGDGRREVIEFEEMGFKVTLESLNLWRG